MQELICSLLSRVVRSDSASAVPRDRGAKRGARGLEEREAKEKNWSSLALCFFPSRPIKRIHFFLLFFVLARALHSSRQHATSNFLEAKAHLSLAISLYLNLA